MKREMAFDWLGRITVATFLLGALARSAGLPGTQRAGVQVAFFVVCLGLLGAYGIHLRNRLRRRDRWEREGRCRECGYDRTGLGVTAPCPECGKSGII